jgi:hypothetical protein
MKSVALFLLAALFAATAALAAVYWLPNNPQHVLIVNEHDRVIEAQFAIGTVFHNAQDHEAYLPIFG